MNGKIFILRVTKESYGFVGGNPLSKSTITMSNLVAIIFAEEKIQRFLFVT